MRVFISYGRADARELAARLAGDLAAAGHTVWLDIAAMTAGRSWEEQIEGAILGCDAFVALLSPHAVRRPDGVCLDEISLARYNGRRIIPAMVVQCRPPLGIYRLDWIDFQDWHAGARYAAALERLLAALAAPTPAAEGAAAALAARLRPLDFGAELARLARGFTGRDWLLDELAAWLDDPAGSRVFLVTGDPGTGKSAVIARLVDRHPRVAGYHLCVASLADSLDPVRFVCSAAAQLRTQLPGYAAALEALDLDARPDAADAGSLLRRLLADPLRTESPDGPLVLAVDALDEGLAYGPRHIARLLAERLDDLPAWLRLVLSTRKEPEILDLFSRFRPHEIDAGRPENAADVARYLARRLAEPSLAARLAAAGVTPEELATRIAAGGAGNFLYVTQAAAALEAGQIDPAAADAFPDGLVGIYAGFFERRFPGGAGFDAARPLLEALIAAREPLPAVALGRVLGRTALAVEAELEPLAAFFPERDGRYRPFHKSVADWLGGRAGRSRRFRVDPAEGHRRLAAALLEEARAERPGAYALAHLPAHLLAAGELAEAAALLTDLGFLEAKCAAGLTYALVADYHAALAQDGWPEATRSEVAAFARFVQANSHVLARRSGLLFPLAANAPDATAPARAARARDAAGRERRPWLRWLNKPQAGATALVMRLLGSQGFNCCAVSPDGHTLAAGADDGALWLWNAETGGPMGHLKGHTGGITGCEFFPDGRRLLTASNDTTLRIWDLPTAAATGVLAGHVRQVNGCAVSPDGTRALSAGEDGRLILWDTAGGTAVWERRPRDLGLYACRFSPDGTLAVCGTRRHAVMLLDARTGRRRARLEGHEGEVRGCAFSPDGRRLATAAADETLRIWDLATGDAVRVVATGQTGGIKRCAFLHGGRWIATAGSWDATVKVWDAADGAPLATLAGHTAWVGGLAAHPDGRHLVSAATDMTVGLWDASAGVAAAAAPAGAAGASPLLAAHAGHACGCEYTAGGTRLVTGSWDGTLKVWDAEGETLLATLAGHAGEVYGGALAPDGRWLASAGADGSVRRWDLQEFRETAAWCDGTGPVRAVDVSPDGRRLAAAGNDGVIRVRATDGPEAVQELAGHRSWVTALRWTPDGAALVSGSYDGTVRVWDAATGAERLCLIRQREPVFAVAVSPDGRRLAAASLVESTRKDVMLRVWELPEGRTLLEATHTALALDLAFSPDGRWLAWAGFDWLLRILDPADGREVAVHRGDTKPCAVAWHPDGRHLAAGCVNGAVWRLRFENVP